MSFIKLWGPAHIPRACVFKSGGAQGNGGKLDAIRLTLDAIRWLTDVLALNGHAPPATQEP
ncbi:hypothetical protein RZS28_09560 [Methylocapsa polymorpha]|uniref:Uncharacterized protein n=1 Tax=Methylocapsa polymorpha TaxID=3080828 RepID=A0ABZ0HNL7_9HYPH|nr:hypothetical protein RZS28_09560 [Methylocapsa sp. RX1]